MGTSAQNTSYACLCSNVYSSSNVVSKYVLTWLDRNEVVQPLDNDRNITNRRMNTTYTGMWITLSSNVQAHN